MQYRLTPMQTLQRPPTPGIRGRVVQSFEIEQISPEIQNIGLKNEDAGETDETKIPDSVNDLETLVSNAGMTMTITWTPPTQDVSGNSLDLSDVTYAVLRSTDGRNYELLQQGITETKYVDNSIKEALDEIGIQQENFSYAVVATNTYGTNNEATAQFAVVGTPFSLPFKESFSCGYVQNNPWTVQSMTGTQGWACISSDYDMYPQDYDEGFIKFYSPFGEQVIDSRIISPLLDLTGTQNPSVTLYVYHWADADITAEGKNTKLIIEVTEDSKTYTQVGETLMATAEEDNWMLPRTGNQCFISWYVMTSIDGVVQSNDDWLISPELANGSTFSFYMRRLRTSTNETFQILSSSTDTYPSSFTTVEQEGIATEDWTLYEIPVKEGVRYIAIRYTGCDQYGLMIDDITYTSAIYYLKIEGYNLFRNGIKLNDRPLTETTYTDTDVAAGQTYRYSISTVYDRGESIVTDEVEVTMTSGVKHIENAAQCLVTTADGCIIIDNESGETVTVYNLGGTPVATSAMPGRSRIEVAAGAYIVKTGNSAVKVLVH